MALAAQMGWKMHIMDVKTTFLNKVVEEIYMEQPKGFETFDRDMHVSKLKRDLYVIKQALRVGTLIMIATFRDCASLRVRQMPICTTSRLEGFRSF